MLREKLPKINLKKTLIFFVCSVLVIGGILSSVMLPSIFRLSSIKVITKDVNIVGLEEINPEVILFINEDKIKKSLTQKNPWIGEVSIEKVLPETLVIVIKNEEVIGYVISGSRVYEITKKGIVANEVKAESKKEYPSVKIEGLIVKKGNTLPANVQKVFEFLAKEKPQSIQVKESEVDLKSPSATFVLKDDTQVIVPLHKIDPAFPASLQTIVERFRIEGKPVSKIDFRFEKPTITFR